MKQLFILFIMFVSAGVANAQCQQATAACCKNKTATASVEQSNKACASMGTVQASNIQKRIDNVSGEVSYFEKAVDASGVISWNKISTDEANLKMTKVASVGMEKTATGEVKAIDMKGAGKACCAPGGAKQNCEAKKAIN